MAQQRTGPANANARGDRGDGRRAGTRLRVFTAAVEVIAEQGYTSATVEAIAERAGVAKGTVFYNFGSKEALFSALLEHGIGRMADALGEAAAGAPAPLDALDAVVLAQLRFFEEYGAFARVLLTEMWRTAWQDAVAGLRERALGVYADVLRRAVADGLVREDLDVETAATAVFGMVLTVSIERRALHPDRPVEQVHATLTDLLHGRVAR
ncbi:AcrR family transcriptional regulator [Streptosporangium becharense]|uniref:AcrR family transcriptional regulator n=1 Tax=Streptosporangium becharense TaxID=1816182 RepID=A0A7W9IEG0_9ACTN|nr:TetR/AcrR family transcriptional regulator [Streptosporangium becharense]MBB2909835.1 AcrR family transcriptional regulator [Streptosporangium becharense]MBB5819210.1 AcrR family transcriptional regulator [Streptosporangium becharense]